MARRTTALLGGLAAMVVCLATVAWSNANQRAHRGQQLERDTQVVAVQVANRLQSGLEKHRIALHQMAAFFQSSEDVTQQQFYQFAAETLRLSPMCLRISVIDPSMRVRWVYPPEHSHDVVGYDVRQHAEGYETMQRAVATAATALSAPLKLVGGAAGFVLTCPVFKNGQFNGAVVCSFRSADFFSAVLLPEVLEGYEEEVLDVGTPLFGTMRTEGPDRIKPAREGFSLGGRTWTVRVRPREAVTRARLDSGQAAFWTMGILLSLAMGGAASRATYWFSAITARLRTQGSALEQTQERLDAAMQQLLQAEKLNALGELVAGVAHEINNPLSAILGYTQLALSANPSPEVSKRLQIVVSESVRAGKIVRNLLTFARKHPPEKKYLGLNGIIEKTLELKAYHFRVSQIRIERGLIADLPMTMLDFHQIQQVLLNLLNNAEHAIVETGRGGSIRISTRQVGERIELRVEDTGRGIPAEIQTRIFEPFFTTKKEGKGTGLGLSLCYGIVAEHGGSISVESQPGNGTAFLIRLPIARPVDATSTDTVQPSASGGSSTTLHVFVVDDEPSVQGFLVDLLTSRGYRVDTASDIGEALKKIAMNSYDLIISDMKMPHGSGKDIYRAVAERNPRLAKRIIFATGDGASQETLAFVRETGNEILSKPFRIEDVEQAITAATRS